MRAQTCDDSQSQELRAANQSAAWFKNERLSVLTNKGCGALNSLIIMSAEPAEVIVQKKFESIGLQFEEAQSLWNNI